MSFNKCPDSDDVCYTKPLDSLKHWNDHFFWVNSFACPASFPWHTGKNVSRDPFPKSTEFSANDYVVLVAHPALFWKFPELFLYLIGMSHNYTLDDDTYPTFVHDDEMGGFADPTKVKVGEQERAEEEARILDSTVGRVVLLLPVALTRDDSELQASVDRLFDQGGSADQGDSAASGGQETETKIVTGVRFITDENVVIENPKHLRKKRQVVMDASVGVATVATLPMITSSVSATLEHESGSPADSITRLNLRTIGTVDSERYVVPPPVMTEAVITTNVASIPSALASKIGTKVISPVHALMFHDSTVRSNAAVSSHIPGKELSIGSQNINSETLHEFKFIAQICEMDYHHLFTEFNVGTARQACLNAEVGMRTKYCLSEMRRLESECKKQADLLKARDAEVESLKAQLLLKETEAAEAAHLHAQVSAAEATEKIHTNEIDALKQRNVALEKEKESLDGKVAKLQSSVSTKDLKLKDLNVSVSSLRSQKDGLVDQVHALKTTCSGLRDQVSGYRRLKEQIEEFQDVPMNIVNDNVAKLDADLLEMALHLEEKFYPHLLTIISGRRWLLTHSLKLSIVKSLNSQDYLSALGAAISEGPLADSLRMNDLQPNVDQLMLPIHRSEDQVVLGETSLSFALSVTYSRVKKIRENVAAKRSALIGVWTVRKMLKETVKEILLLSPTVEFEKEELDTTLEHDQPI
ncbi:hypothetical protein Tco_0639198 [Tanacetum coccineum]